MKISDIPPEPRLPCKPGWTQLTYFVEVDRRRQWGPTRMTLRFKSAGEALRCYDRRTKTGHHPKITYGYLMPGMDDITR